MQWGHPKNLKIICTPKTRHYFLSFAIISSNTPWSNVIKGGSRLDKSAMATSGAVCLTPFSLAKFSQNWSNRYLEETLIHLDVSIKNPSFQQHFPSANLMQVRKSAFGNAHELSPNLMRVRTSVSTLVRAAPVRVVWSSDGYRKPCGLTMPGSQAERALMWLFVLKYLKVGFCPNLMLSLWWFINIYHHLPYQHTVATMWDSHVFPTLRQTHKDRRYFDVFLCDLLRRSEQLLSWLCWLRGHTSYTTAYIFPSYKILYPYTTLCAKF